MLKIRTSHIKNKDLRSSFTPRVDQDTKFSTQLFYISEEDLPEVGDRVSLSIQIEKGNESKALKWLQYYVSKAFDMGGLIRPWNTQIYGPDNLSPELTHPNHKIPSTTVKLFQEGPLSDTEYFLVPVCIEALYGIRRGMTSVRNSSASKPSFTDLVLSSTKESDLCGKLEGDTFIRGTGGIIASLPDIKGYKLGKLLLGPIALEPTVSNCKPYITLAVAVPVLPANPDNPTDLSLSASSAPYTNTNKNSWLAAAVDVRSYLMESKFYTQSYTGLVPIAEEHNKALHGIIDAAPEVNGKKVIQVVIPVNTRKLSLTCKTINKPSSQVAPDSASVEHLVIPPEFEAIMEFAAPMAFLEGNTGIYGFRNPITSGIDVAGAEFYKKRSILDQSICSLFEPGGESSLISSVNVTIDGKTVKSICSLCPKRNTCALANFDNHNLGCLKTLNIYKDTLANVKAKSEAKDAK